MKTYRLRSQTTYWLHVVLVPCVAVLTGVAWIWIAITRPESVRGGPPAWVGILWLVWLVWGLFRYVTMPHTIELTNAGTIRFIGAFRTTALVPSDIVSVDAFAGQFIYVRHTSGKVLLLRQFGEFHEFLGQLQEANSQVRVRGL